MEERFRTEYLIAIVVAVVLLLIISLVVTTLLAMRCQRSRAKRLHRGSTASTTNAIESSELKRSRSGGDLSNTDTVATQVNHLISLHFGQTFLPDFWQFFVLVTDKWLKEVIRGLSTVLWSSSSVRIIIRCHCVVMNKRDLYQGKKALITEKKVMLMSPFFWQTLWGVSFVR